MNQDQFVEFSFDERLFQVWVRLETEICRNRALLNLIERQTKAWLDKLFQNGLIVDYFYDDAALQRTWTLLEKTRSGSARLKIAQGWPALPGLEIKPSATKSSQLVVSLEAGSESLKRWDFSWIEGRVLAESKKMFPVASLFNPTRLFELWIRKLRGIKTSDSVEIVVMEGLQRNQVGKTYAVQSDEKRGTVEIHLYDLKSVTDPKALDELKSEANTRLSELSRQKTMHASLFLWDEIVGGIKAAGEGGPSLGLGLPLKLLAGLLFRPDGEKEAKIRNALSNWIDALNFAGSVDWYSLYLKKEVNNPMFPINDLILQAINLRAQNSLMTTKPQERYMVTSSLVLHPGQLEKARGLLAKLAENIRSICSRNAKGSGTFNMGLHFFPVANFEATAKVEELHDHHPWLIGTIREMTQFPEFFSDACWIRDRLVQPVSTSQIEIALQRLKSAGFIRFDEPSKRWQPSQPVIVTDNQLQGGHITQFHQGILDISSRTVARIPPNARFVKTLGLKLDEAQFQDCKNEIEVVSKGLLDLESEEPVRSVVYTLSAFLFPVL